MGREEEFVAFLLGPGKFSEGKLWKTSEAKTYKIICRVYL